MEHEPVPNRDTKESPAGYSPTTEERDAIKLVNRLYERARKRRKRYDDRWQDYYKMFRGKQWREQRPSYRHSEVINMVFQNIQAMVPILTDARPKIEFIPEEPSDREFAEILNQISESDWQRGNWSYKLTELIYDGHFFGTGIGTVDWDAKAKMGIGAVNFNSVDPFYCFPDPNATDVNERSEYFCFAEPVDIEILKREYPDKKEYITSDLQDSFAMDRTDLDIVRYQSPTDKKSNLEGTSPIDTYESPKALKITVYITKPQDYTEKENKTVDGNGIEQTSYEQALKYPNGRKICIASGVLLDDGPLPYEDAKAPYFKWSNYILPREFWGISEVEQLESPQKIFNKLVSFALDVLTIMGNPVWIVDNDSGVDVDNLVNRPGLVIEKNRESTIRREEGVQLQPYVFQLIDRMKSWFDDISGNNDVSRGVRPDGITAAAAINSLQEAAKTRIRQKARNLDAALQTFGQLYLSRVLQFYTAPQIFRLTNNQGATKYFKFHIEERPLENGDVQKVGILRNYVENPENGALSESIEAKEVMIKGLFDVRVATGSALPFAKQEKINMAQMLFDRGAIDEVELLKSVDYPNWEGVWERVKAAKAAAAMPPAPQPEMMQATQPQMPTEGMMPNV